MVISSGLGRSNIGIADIVEVADESESGDVCRGGFLLVFDLVELDLVVTGRECFSTSRPDVSRLLT
jgi:hypothetical protein